MNYVRRFFFVQYHDLLALRLKKLEKLSDKLYVFTPASVEDVPLPLVRQLQRMGSDLEWVDLGDVSGHAAASIIAFHIGVLHEQVDLGVEFALLSDDAALEPLVNHIQGTGRSCVRVRQQTENGSKASNQDAAAKQTGNHRDSHQEEHDVNGGSGEGILGYDEQGAYELVDLDLEEAPAEQMRASTATQTAIRPTNASTSSSKPKLRERLATPTPLSTIESASPTKIGDDEGEVAPLADELVRRLIRSGNRPADLSMLRSYIVLHTDEAAAVRHVDHIIEYMEKKGEIRVSDGDVSYNF